LSAAFIGLTDTKTEGQFEWVTPKQGDYRNWCGGEPNDVGGEDCTELFTRSCWNDVGCGQKRGFICESRRTKQFNVAY